MKFWGGFLTQILNIFVIVQSDGVDSVITDFIAFGIIAEIDDMMAMTIKDFNVADLIDTANKTLHFNHEQSDETKLNKLLENQYEKYREQGRFVYLRKKITYGVFSL